MHRVLVGLMLVACSPMPPTPDAGDPLMSCDGQVAEVTLASGVQAEVFDRQCRSCHNAADPTNGDFSNASRTAASVARRSSYGSGLKQVEPGDLSRSVLWRKLNGVDGVDGAPVGGVMPPAGKLGATSLKLVKDWICTGAK